MRLMALENDAEPSNFVLGYFNAVLSAGLDSARAGPRDLTRTVYPKRRYF